MVRASPVSKVRRLDLLAVAWRSLGAALIYFTGNTIFNRELRKKADGLGMKLSNDGLYRTRPGAVPGGKRVKTELICGGTEAEVFEALGERWREPDDRNM